MTRSTFDLIAAGTCIVAGISLAACGDGSAGTAGAGGAAQSAPAPAKAPAADAHDHAHGDHAHDHKDGDAHSHGGEHGGEGHSHGPTVQLGEQSSGALAIKASRDGDVTPGGELPVDIWITGGSARVSSVRFWVGIESGKGSVKAKAALEADNWHNHAEVPSPLPEGSKLWISIELSDGTKSLVSFDLKS